ncbi:hypothetical protein [Streptomyces naphthomycinicus]|uniref:hypothetical protein n=1 Tax=Streptomyces naphthomycinicus TaxID=2872625 RepID=UPI001CEC7D86|nr:hypothetical protein [Streptomyces sp. TML10]
MEEPSSAPARPTPAAPARAPATPARAPATPAAPAKAPDDSLDWFRQQPEHTLPGRPETDPVRTVRQLPRFRLGGRRFTGRIDHALVCVTRAGRYDTYLPPDRPASVRPYAALYEVDTAPHSFRLRVPLPSRVDSFEFEATVDVTWRVADPEAFVRSQERDVPGLVTRALLPELRSAARGHPIEHSAEAETSVQRQAAEHAPSIGTEEGLRVGCTLRLRRDAAERSHQTRLRTARHETEAVAPEHRAALAHERFEAERRAERIAFYEHHLARGGAAALALHLATHPADTPLVLGHLGDEQTKLVEHQLQLISQAIDGDRLEDYQLETPHRLIAERMAALLRATDPFERATGAAAELTKPARAEGPAAPGA